MRLRSAWAPLLVIALTLARFDCGAQSLKPTLNASTARAMIQGCEAKAREQNWKMNIAIVDDGGNLNAFERMDGAILLSGKIAVLKANTAASIPVSTRQYGEISKQVHGMELLPGTTTIAGGLPIVTRGGLHLGGIGVSGGSPEQDEACAQAGLDAVKSLLN